VRVETQLQTSEGLRTVARIGEADSEQIAAELAESQEESIISEK